MAGRFSGPRFHYTVALVLYLGLAVGAAVTVGHRAEKGRGAFVRWIRQTEGLRHEQTIYRRRVSPTGLDEGYPHAPFMALVLRPFQALGAPAGAATWALFKALLFSLVAVGVFRYPREWGPPFPAWTAPVLVLLSAQVIHLDLTHSNTNLLIGTLVAGALLATRADRDLLAGLAIGLAGVLKVTPLLFIPYFLWKRRFRALLGVAIGLCLFAILVPGLVLGFDYNQELLASWSDQMLAPFVTGEPPGYMQTSYTNQSMSGVLLRLFTESRAVWPQPDKGVAEVRVNVASLDPAVVAWIARALALVVLGVLAAACRTPRNDRRHMANVGEFGLVFLAMLFLSERSWRPHYVLIGLSHVFLLYDVTVGGATGLRRRAGIVALVVSLLTHHGAWDELLGDDAARMLECYGIFLFGALVLFVVTAGVLVALRRRGFPVPPCRPAE